jgi:hypothetical protein
MPCAGSFRAQLAAAVQSCVETFQQLGVELARQHVA